MPKLTSAADIVKVLPHAPATKRAAGEGQVVKPFDLSLTFKVKAEETSFQFSVYEMTIQPGKSIPLHIHPFVEFFYCLEGRVDVMQVDAEGLLSWVPLTGGDCAYAPSNAPHGVKNRSEGPAKFLSVSTLEHQKAFDEYQAVVETSEGAALSEEEKGTLLTDLFAKYNTTFLDAHER